MALSDQDWQRLDHKFEALHQEIKESGSKVHKIDARLIQLEASSPHKCEEAVQKHEAGAWSHNPKKAITLGASILGLWEGVRTFLHK